MKRTFATLFFGISLIILSGCCSINKQAAQKLAEQGAATSTEIANSYGAAKQQLVTYVEGEYLLSGLKDGYSKPGTNMLDSIKRVQTELTLRKQMLEDLGTLYAAFAALCAYDAATETEKAAGELAAAGKSYADTVFPGTSIPDAAGQMFAKGTGQLAGQAQNRRIRNANRQICSNLEGIVFLLQQQKEQEALTSIREEISRNRLKVAKALWNENLGLADNILDGQVSSYGLTLNRDAAKAAPANPKLKHAIEQVLESRHNSEMEASGEAYAAAIAALKKLKEEHKKLEKGEPVSLTSLKTDLTVIQEYVDLVTALRKEHK
jgi:hypothetical protein